jgi:hypothetical protein
MIWDTQSGLSDFRTVADLAGIRLCDNDIQVEELAAPHVAPSRLPVNKMAVYVFSRGSKILNTRKIKQIGKSTTGTTTSVGSSYAPRMRGFFCARKTTPIEPMEWPGGRRSPWDTTAAQPR